MVLDPFNVNSVRFSILKNQFWSLWPIKVKLHQFHSSLGSKYLQLEERSHRLQNQRIQAINRNFHLPLGLGHVALEYAPDSSPSFHKVYHMAVERPIPDPRPRRSTLVSPHSHQSPALSPHACWRYITVYDNKHSGVIHFLHWSYFFGKYLGYS